MTLATWLVVISLAQAPDVREQEARSRAGHAADRVRLGVHGAGYSFVISPFTAAIGGSVELGALFGRIEFALPALGLTADAGYRFTWGKRTEGWSFSIGAGPSAAVYGLGVRPLFGVGGAIRPSVGYAFSPTLLLDVGVSAHLLYVPFRTHEGVVVLPLTGLSAGLVF